MTLGREADIAASALTFADGIEDEGARTPRNFDNLGSTTPAWNPSDKGDGEIHTPEQGVEAAVDSSGEGVERAAGKAVLIEPLNSTKYAYVTDSPSRTSFLSDPHIQEVLPKLDKLPLQLCGTSGKTPEESWREGRFEGQMVRVCLDRPIEATSKGIRVEETRGSRTSIQIIPAKFLKPYSPVAGDDTLVVAGFNTGLVARVVSGGDGLFTLQAYRGTAFRGSPRVVETSDNMIVVIAKKSV